MIIGTPKEVKANETRVAMTPCWAKKLVKAGHEIWMQKGAGLNAGFADSDYVSAGANIADTAEEVFRRADFITKVKELQYQEFDLIREDQMIMTWFHLAEDYDKPMAQALEDRKSIGLSMELIVLDDGSRPTMKPMSDIAGSLAMLESVKYCQTINGGTGFIGPAIIVVTMVMAIWVITRNGVDFGAWNEYITTHDVLLASGSWVMAGILYALWNIVMCLPG